ncbi:unnamed protein product [Closterium sp. NIES-54]
MVTTTTPRGPVAPPCSCPLLSHQTLLWHHRLGHPSLPRLRGMHSRLLVSSLPRSLPPLPPLPAPACLPCVEVRQRATPHSSLPPTTAPLQTLHTDGILQSFMLPESPRQNGIAERHIGLVMEVARTSNIHATATHFLWPFASLAPSGVYQVDPLPGTLPVEVVVNSGASRGAACGGAACGGAEPGGVDPGGVECGGAESDGARSGGAESGGAERCDTTSSGGDSVDGDTGAGGARVTSRAGGTRGALAAGPRGACTRGIGAARIGSVGDAGAGDSMEPGAAGAGGARDGGTSAAVDLGAGGAGAEGVESGGTGAGGSVRPRPYFVPLLQQPASALPAPSPYTAHTSGLIEHREPASRPASLVRTGRRVPRLRPPPVPGTHAMALRPSSVPLRVPLPPPPESSLPAVPDPESDRARAANPTVSRLLATVVTDPSFDSTTVSALVAELVDFAAACRLDYANALVPESAESESASHPSVRGECALGTDVLEHRQEDFDCLAPAVPRFASMLLAPERDPDAPNIPTPRSYVEAITGPYSSQWQVTMDAKMASWKSTGTYVDAVPPSRANIIDGRWIFKGVDYFQTFSPTPKITTLRVLLHVAAQRDYELHSLDFSTSFLQGSLHEEIWLRRPPGFTGSFPASTQWSLHRPVYGLRQTPREWHDTLRTTLAALGFTPSNADPSLFLRTDTSLAPFYVLVYIDDLVFAIVDTRALTLVMSELQKRHTCIDVLQRFGFQFSSPQPTPLTTGHSLSAPPLDKPVELSGSYPELVGCLMYLMTCTRPDLAYPLSLLARYVAPGRHRKVHWDAAKRVLRYLCSTSGMQLMLGGRGRAVLTCHTNASWVDDSATQRSSQGYTFSFYSGSISWRSTRSSSVLISSCEAEIYAGDMAAQELRRLTYLLTELGEQPHSPPVLYVDNKAMISLYQEHRLEHKMKHITLRYFLARELQQRCQLRLAYVATRANTADIFTKALPPGDHQRLFCVRPCAYFASLAHCMTLLVL